jgi:hypothetical protein
MGKKANAGKVLVNDAAAIARLSGQLDAGQSLISGLANRTLGADAASNEGVALTLAVAAFEDRWNYTAEILGNGMGSVARDADGYWQAVQAAEEHAEAFVNDLTKRYDDGFTSMRV